MRIKLTTSRDTRPHIGVFWIIFLKQRLKTLIRIEVIRVNYSAFLIKTFKLYIHDILKHIWISMSLEARMKQQKKPKRFHPSKQLLSSAKLLTLSFFSMLSMFFSLSFVVFNPHPSTRRRTWTSFWTKQICFLLLELVWWFLIRNCKF